MKLKDDIAIERVREVRHRLSAEHGHDPKKIVNYYIELQKKYENRLENFSKDEEEISEPIKSKFS